MSLGAYMLGALDAEEAVLVEAHLVTCPDCRDEFDELSGLTSMLARVSEQDIDQAATPPHAVLDRLIAASAKRHRMNRLVFSLAASLIAVVLGGTAWLAFGDSQHRDFSVASAPVPSSASGDAARRSTAQQDQSSKALAATPGRSPAIENAPATPAPSPSTAASAAAVSLSRTSGSVRVQLGLFPREAGTRIEVAMSGVPDGTSCRVTAIGTDGTRSPAGSWTVDFDEYHYHGSPARFTTHTELSLNRIGAFDIRTSKGKRIIWIPYEH
jgi:hypothetical protein